jgi:hypothetical protein
MSTLTYTASHAATAAKPERRGFWRGVYEGFMASQQRRADREIARYIERHGGVLTDDLERRIMRRLAGGDRATV